MKPSGLLFAHISSWNHIWFTIPCCPYSSKHLFRLYLGVVFFLGPNTFSIGLWSIKALRYSLSPLFKSQQLGWWSTIVQPKFWVETCWNRPSVILEIPIFFHNFLLLTFSSPWRPWTTFRWRCNPPKPRPAEASCRARRCRCTEAWRRKGERVAVHLGRWFVNHLYHPF